MPTARKMSAKKANLPVVARGANFGRQNSKMKKKESNQKLLIPKKIVPVRQKTSKKLIEKIITNTYGHDGKKELLQMYSNLQEIINPDDDVQQAKGDQVLREGKELEESGRFQKQTSNVANPARMKTKVS